MESSFYKYNQLSLWLVHTPEWRGRDKTVLSFPRRRYEQAITNVTVSLYQFGSTLCFKKRTHKRGCYNFIKIGPLWTISSDNASALNCQLTAFEKLDMGWVLNAQFPWQQQHHAAVRIQEAELKPWVVKVWADFQLTGAHTSGENDSNHVPRLRDSILNSCCDLYFCLSFIVCTDSLFAMIEKSKCNDRWRISISMLLW